MKLFLSSVYTFIFITVFTSLATGQQINGNWEPALNKSLSQFETCNDDCYKYHGITLNEVYKVNDFFSAEKDRYLTVSETKDYLDQSAKWEKLGPAYDPEVLQKAQTYANNKKAALAIYLDENEIGHIALILPGELQMSGSWGMKVPNSASFLVSDPSSSYVSKSLSYAFKRSQLKHVELYGRKY